MQRNRKNSLSMNTSSSSTTSWMYERQLYTGKGDATRPDVRYLLDLIEEQINPQHHTELLRRHKAAMRFRPVDRPPVTVTCPPRDQFVPWPYVEAFADPRKMLYNELLYSFSDMLSSFEIRDDYPPQIRPNYGTVIIASLFGAHIELIGDNTPWAHKLGGIDRIKQCLANGVPNLQSGLTPRIVETYEVYCEILRDYPKAFSTLAITQPDLQGPLETASMLWGSDFYGDLIEHRDTAEAFLSLLVKTYLAYLEFLRPYLKEDVGEGCIVLHGWVLPGGCLIKSDSAIMLSPQMNREITNRYNAAILEGTGGGGIHFCGNGNHLLGVIDDTPGLTGIDMGEPHLNDLDTWLTTLADKKIALGRLFVSQEQALKLAREHRFRTGISLVVSVPCIEEGKRFLDEFVKAQS